MENYVLQMYIENGLPEKDRKWAFSLYHKYSQSLRDSVFAYGDLQAMRLPRKDCIDEFLDKFGFYTKVYDEFVNDVNQMGHSKFTLQQKRYLSMLIIDCMNSLHCFYDIFEMDSEYTDVYKNLSNHMLICEYEKVIHSLEEVHIIGQTITAV